MNAIQMRAALAQANLISTEKDTMLGVMLASAQRSLVNTTKALVTGTISAANNVATGYTYQRALDKGLVK